MVAPEEAARAARADAKRRELILLEEECEKERVVEEEHVRILEEKRREVQMAAGRVGRDAKRVGRGERREFAVGGEAGIRESMRFLERRSVSRSRRTVVSVPLLCTIIHIF